MAAACADNVRAGRKVQVGYPVDTWAESKRNPCCRRLIDGRLKGAGLIVGAARSQAQVVGVQAHRRARRRCGSPRERADGRGGSDRR